MKSFPENTVAVALIVLPRPAESVRNANLQASSQNNWTGNSGLGPNSLRSNSSAGDSDIRRNLRTTVLKEELAIFRAVHLMTAWQGKWPHHRTLVHASYLPWLPGCVLPCCVVTLWRMCHLGNILLLCLLWVSEAWDPIQSLSQLFIFCNLCLCVNCTIGRKLYNLRRERDIIHGWTFGFTERQV